MADLIITESGAVHRPRNVDWKRAGALLYGDWGTSKAYVIGLAFLAAGFSSFPIILAVCALTGLVGINYMVICRHFPDGGGVYSAARSQGRLLAVMGALLLLADLTVTAALSGWSALTYITSGAEQVFWIRPVPVDRGPADAGLLGHPLMGDGARSFPGEQVKGGGQDRLTASDRARISGRRCHPPSL